MMLFDLHIICKTVANGDISLLESSLKLGVVYLFFISLILSLNGNY